jgi:hypothetical protein
VRGRLDRSYDWFPGMDVENQNEQAILRGPVVDQAALHGLLSTIRDLNLELLFVINLDSSNLPDRTFELPFENHRAHRKEKS